MAVIEFAQIFLHTLFFFCEWGRWKNKRISLELINLILCQVRLASSAGNENLFPYGYTWDTLTAASAWSERKISLHWSSRLSSVLISAPFGRFEAINPFCFIYFSLHFRLRLKPCHDWLSEKGPTGFPAKAQKPHFAHAASVNGICLLIIQGKLSKLLSERAGKDKKFFFPEPHKRASLKSTRENHGCIPKQKSFFHPVLFMFISLKEHSQEMAGYIMLSKFIFCRRHSINIGIYVCFAAFLIVAAKGFIHLVLYLAATKLFCWRYGRYLPFF